METVRIDPLVFLASCPVLFEPGAIQCSSVEVEIEVEGGQSGSFSHDADSDIDYRGSAASIDTYGKVILHFDHAPKRVATGDVRSAVLAWCQDNEPLLIDARDEQLACDDDIDD